MQDIQEKRKKLRGHLDPALQRSNAVLITGGTDNKNMPLVTFSVNEIDKHSVTSNDLQCLLKYNLTYFWGQKRSTCPTFAALANLADCSKETIVNFLACLDAIQSEGTGSVGASYIISPMSHSNQKVLRKLLGVYPSKKYKRNSLYKVVVVADDEELAEYIDFTQLTPDFGGYLLFSQQHFITFSKNVEDLEDAINDCLRQCPSAEQDLMNFTEQTEIKRETQMAKTGLKMELLIDKCKEVIDELAQPDEHTGVKTIKQHPLLAEKREILSTAHAQLLSWRQKLQRHWQITESQIVADARLMKNERKLKKIQDWISTVGIRHVKKTAPIATSPSEANILYTHYKTSFYSTAKRVVWLAHKLAEKMETILDEKQESHDFSAAADRSEQFVKTFKQEVIYFDHLVEKKCRVFLDVVHHFQHHSGNSDAIWALDAFKDGSTPNMNNTLAQTSLPHRVLQLQKIAEQEGPLNEAGSVVIRPGKTRTQNEGKTPTDERYVSLNSSMGNGPKLPRSLKHIDPNALENNEPQVNGNPPTKKGESLTFAPVDMVAQSNMTAAEKMAALTALCEPEVVTPPEMVTDRNAVENVVPKYKSENTESEMSTLSEESYYGVDIEKWMEEGQLDLEASGEEYVAGYLDDLKLDASEVHLARLRLDSEEIIQDSIEQSLNRTMDMLQVSGKEKYADEDAVSGSDESGFFTLMGSKINPASLEILNKFCEEEERQAPEGNLNTKSKGKDPTNPWLSNGASIPSWLSSHQNNETFDF
ncbi:hypothetical protein CAPTEDRAFT_189274 [Capitella teleta]|uniref:CRAL-TRIO domain-containing protein n=1 Tax=Capitella teleta TaxID=283909 RepID=R7UKB9_CAPTE|nr:hypothetical protein CAPTEDRAFT_189274 [Capitella teleta]|eukprot:ELU06640.1 hypothetical protein CAPTEDRAFT_189274 [Capitella teleta]